MFIGRERELDTLKDLYESDKFEFVVLYGRRRVGKTTLLAHFVQNKPTIYCSGVEATEAQNLQNFTARIVEFENGTVEGYSFNSFEIALERVFKLAQNERVVLVIDEYPYMARASKGLGSVLQLLIDKHKDTSKLMLVLCGSSVSYMEDEVLAYKAPLYGRRTAQIKLKPFGFGDVCKSCASFSGEDKALAYGVFGGTPAYLLQIDPEHTLQDNIIHAFLTSSAPLFEEPMSLLRQELREPASYNSIISAIAAGSSRLSEISAILYNDLRSVFPP